MNKTDCMCFALEREQAVYRYKNSDGGYSEYTLDTPRLVCGQNGKYDKCFNPFPGLMVFSTGVPRDMGRHYSFDVSGSYYSFSFIISGEISYCLNVDGETEYMDPSVENTVLFSRAREGKSTAEKKKGAGLSFVSLLFDPTLLHVFLGEDVKRIRSEYAFLLDGNEPKEHDIASFSMSPGYLANVNQIIKCPLDDMWDRFFVTNQVQELFTSVLRDYILMPCAKHSVNLSESDLLRIQEVRNILSNSLSAPPSLKQLSRKTGLNEMKLKSGFKEVFGTTVFGYVRREKMKWAKKLLESGRYNVSEAAWEVGYTNVSHFITCFSRHYSVSPGKYIRNRLSA